MEAPVRCVKMTLSWYEMTHESHCRYTKLYVDIVWNIKLISCKIMVGWFGRSMEGGHGMEWRVIWWRMCLTHTEPLYRKI